MLKRMKKHKAAVGATREIVARGETHEAAVGAMHELVDMLGKQEPLMPENFQTNLM